MKPLALVGDDPFWHHFIAGVEGFRLPLLPYFLEEAPPPEALAGMALWGLAGLGLFPAQSPPKGVRLEAEAQAAGRVDLLWPGPGGVYGQYTLGVGLARFLRDRFLGARALWTGRMRPELAPFLRGLAQVHVLAPSRAEGEAFLARLSPAVRGEVALRREEAQALALRADLVVHGGGALPLWALAPYHHLLLLEAAPTRGLDQVERVYPLEEVFPHRMRALLEALGYPL